ncbi:acyl-CoA dehydrogenase family protein [Streptomyces jeddahensis]|uniref:Acyl-CoA dehydrogenase, short-chain specific n=1 Tax=Streptomyces jeddahensis TaxID=1716141 RepID=A0A177I150_9ACTN|nr:acyl-CoA dehydrogenase family protein [Streptomyces jeddahensis]OAH16549.1 acyl-CoA dehydrogenase, short-chain specific [Streptomyces jeddahensis]
MRFLLDDEQAEFGRTLDRMLSAAGTPRVVRAWAAGDPGPGRALWSRLAEAGVFALAVPEAYDGLGPGGPLPVELAVAYVELGRHVVPGPVVETAAAAALMADLPAVAKEWLPRIASSEAVVSLRLDEAASPRDPYGSCGPYALDADAADAVFTVSGDELRLAPGHGPLRASADPARRLFRPSPGGELLASGPVVRESAARAAGWAAFLTAAQSLGVGLALLHRTVAYTKQRTQFGAPIGSFQAVKHRIADTLLALEFARPLLFGAALSMAPADIAAAKVAAGEAAYAAARTALQLHGAIGYTEELDLSLWLRKARPLRDAWGTPGACRATVLDASVPAP